MESNYKLNFSSSFFKSGILADIYITNKTVSPAGFQIIIKYAVTG